MVHNNCILNLYNLEVQKTLRKFLPKSTFGRFLLILIVPVIFSQLTVGIIFSEKYTQTVLGIISRQMAGEATAVAKLLDTGCADSSIEELKNSMNLNIEVINDSKLRKRGISKNHKAYRILKRALLKKGVNDYYIDTHDTRMDVYIPSNNGNDVYKISFSRKNLYMKIIPIVLGWGFVSSVLLLTIAFIFLKNQIRPIKKLARATQNFGKGIDTNEYIPEGAKEIRMAGIAFCEMKQSVRDLMNTRMKVLAGISHDLRTPLTKMKLQLSLMPKTKEIWWLSHDVNMMIKITESFTIHMAEQNKEIFIHRNLYAFFNETVADHSSGNFNVKLVGDKRIEVSIKYTTLKRAFDNIISNAEKYAENLYINFSQNNENIEIRFEDDGVGIEEGMADALFSPFTKQNSARTHGKGDGVGLGLSIARDAIIAHGGKISASNSATYGGACFTVILPIRDFWKSK
jgi:two-component system osmolarity sensor histidine kinase EnvZ